MVALTPQAILLHRCETGNTGDEVKAAEAKAGLGYHYFVRRSGVVDELYAPDILVWHALHYSRSCLGVALAGDFNPSDGSRNCQPTNDQLAATLILLVRLWHRFGPLPLLGHTDMPHASTDATKVCPGSNLDVRSLQAKVYAAFSVAPLKVPLA